VGSKHGKMDQKLHPFKFQILNMVVFNINIDSKLFKNLIMKASTLLLGFDELNTKFKKL